MPRWLNCLIEGDPTVFPVQVNDDCLVGRLKVLVKTERGLGTLKDPHALKLYKVNINLETHNEHSLHKVILENHEKELPSWKYVLGHWMDEPPPADHLHIIAKVPPTEKDLFNEVPDRGMKRRRSELDDLITERSRLAKMAKRAPSSLSKPSTFQTLTQQVVACNRPFNFDTIPITLLQEEFGLFMDDCKLLPSPKSQELLQALTVAACKWHENETQRRSEIQKVLDDVAGLYLSAETIAGTEYTTNGNLRVNIMPPVIRQCKNEVGCALLEAIAYYSLRCWIDVACATAFLVFFSLILDRILGFTAAYGLESVYMSNL